jgi:hypothetical protein
MALFYSLKLGIVMPPALDFLLRNVLAYSRSFVFPFVFQDDFSISVQNVIGILIGTALNM